VLSLPFLLFPVPIRSELQASILAFLAAGSVEERAAILYLRPENSDDNDNYI